MARRPVRKKLDKKDCRICGNEIKVQIFKGSGVCSETCRKDRDNDHEPFKAVNLRIHVGEDV